MAESEPLSRCLSMALRLANAVGDSEFASWLRLELLGYFDENPATSNSVVVPEYRAVSGQWLDANGRVLVLSDSRLGFINEERLRQGVAELEGLAEASGLLVMQPTRAAEIIKEHLRVNVVSFRFSSYSVKQVVSNIRANLLDRLAKYEARDKTLPDYYGAEEPEILELKPNFYGIGVNLKALWQRIRRHR